MASNLSWVPVVGSIGHHLMAGRSAVAHCWETRHGHWLTLMSEMDGKNLGPIHGPFGSRDQARTFAEKVSTPPAPALATAPKRKTA
jgi:hypothetical protein